MVARVRGLQGGGMVLTGVVVDLVVVVVVVVAVGLTRLSVCGAHLQPVCTEYSPCYPSGACRLRTGPRLPARLHHHRGGLIEKSPSRLAGWGTD